MSETSTGYGMNDRLASLRQGASPADARQVPRADSRMRIEVLLGIVLIGCGLIAALFLTRGTSTPLEPAAPDEVVATTLVPSPVAGEMLVPIAVKEGNFPPSLDVGDLVRVIVTPSIDGFGDLRALPERTVVHSIDSPSDLGTDWIITLVGNENVLAAVAGSGPVRLGIIGGAQ